MVLIIDNYDSFTYNLAQLFGMLGAEVVVKRNDEITPAAIAQLGPDHICISPGPGRPVHAGISCEVVRLFGLSRPILGVCLGHQCIAQVFGGEIIAAPRLMHGKTSPIRHNGRGLFHNLPQDFSATRYHSLAVRRDTLPECLTIVAEADDGEIMALQHQRLPLYGVQFHPESILTSEGDKLLRNFLALAPAKHKGE